MDDDMRNNRKRNKREDRGANACRIHEDEAALKEARLEMMVQVIPDTKKDLPEPAREDTLISMGSSVEQHIPNWSRNTPSLLSSDSSIRAEETERQRLEVIANTDILQDDQDGPDGRMKEFMQQQRELPATSTTNDAMSEARQSLRDSMPIAPNGLFSPAQSEVYHTHLPGSVWQDPLAPQISTPISSLAPGNGTPPGAYAAGGGFDDSNSTDMNGFDDSVRSLHSFEAYPPRMPELAHSETLQAVSATPVDDVPLVPAEPYDSQSNYQYDGAIPSDKSSPAAAMTRTDVSASSTLSQRMRKGTKPLAACISVLLVGALCLLGLGIRSTNRSTLDPPLPPSPRHFADLPELRQAVRDYIHNSGEGTTVARTYGWPIGTWNVSQVTSFYRLFSAATHGPIASVFNEDLSGWDTSRVVTLEECFMGASAFDQDLSSWDVSRVDWMVGVFQDAIAFNGNITNWDVSHVYSMVGMFQNATKFNQNISGWKTSRLRFLIRTFSRASAFNQDLSGWDVARVLSMVETFSLSTRFNADISTWDTRNVDDMTSIFEGATVFDGNVMSWNVSSVVSMTRAFVGAESFDQDLSAWRTSNVRFFRQAFAGATRFNGDVSTWDVSSAFDMTEMFYSASAFRQNLCSWREALREDVLAHRIFHDSSCEDASNPLLDSSSTGPFCARCDITPGSFLPSSVSTTDANGFKCFESLEELEIAVDIFLDDDDGDDFEEIAEHYGETLGSWCVSRVTSFYKLFDGSRNDKAYTFNEDISEWDTSGATCMEGMFRRAFFFDQDLSRWNVSKVETMREMFADARAFNQDLSAWDTSHVISMERMFERAISFYGGAGNVAGRDTNFMGGLRNWNTSRVRITRRMFFGCSSFNQDVSSWDMSNVLYTERMFSGCSAFNQDLDRWNVSRMTTANAMFQHATAFNGNISTWDVSQTRAFALMFSEARAFDQDLSRWDVSKARTIGRMFVGAWSFNADISEWNVSQVIAFRRTFEGAVSFNRDLSSWDVSSGEFFAGMFASIPHFDYDLCEWGDRFQPDFILSPELPMFFNTSCDSTDDPDELSTPIGPLCSVCNTNAVGLN